jgi:hypothetical protein
MSWRKRFEYLEVKVRLGEASPADVLNKLGEDGWRVVTQLDGLNSMYASFLVERESEADPGSEYSQR